MVIRKIHLCPWLHFAFLSKVYIELHIVCLSNLWPLNYEGVIILMNNIIRAENLEGMAASNKMSLK